MRYFIKNQSVPLVESVDADDPYNIRMLQLKSKPATTLIPTRISQRQLKAIRLDEQSAPISGPPSGRYCMIPPAPTPSEAAELLSLEFQMMNLPILTGVIVDDVEALAWVNEVDLDEAINAQVETGAFDDEEPKSHTGAVTVIPKGNSQF